MNKHILLTPLTIGNQTINNRLIVAPMAGVTDNPFRRLAKSFGAGHAISEMIIPAKKVCRKLSGSALLQDLDLVKKLLDSAVESVANLGVPITLKTRLGFANGQENILTVAKIAENAGISALAIHGRTREDFYTGNARYELIKTVKETTNMPIIVNGDIDTPQKAKWVQEYTGADAVMIGRAGQGRPWIFREIAHYLATGEMLAPPTLGELREIVLNHLDELYQFYGEYSGCRIARKHIAWYTGGLTNANAFHEAMYHEETTCGQYKVVDEFFKTTQMSK